MTKIILFLVCATLLQFAFCMPKSQTRNDTNHKSIEQNTLTLETGGGIEKELTLAEKSRILNERKRLIDMIIDGSTRHYVYLLKGTYKIAKDILADPTVISTNTIEAQKEKVILDEFINDMAGILKQTSDKCIQHVLKKFFTFTNRHTKKMENSLNDVDIWAEALTRHGMDEFETEEDKLLNEVGNQYADEFENYLKSLSKTGRAIEENLEYVYETYMENKNIMDRANYGYRYRDVLLELVGI